MEIKTTPLNTIIHLLKSQKLKLLMEQLERSYTAGGNVNGKTTLKNSSTISLKVKIYL